MYVDIHTEGPSLACRNMYQRYILQPASSIIQKDLPLQRRLIGDVLGFSTMPAAGEGIPTHPFYVSLVSSQMETVSCANSSQIVDQRVRTNAVT